MTPDPTLEAILEAAHKRFSSVTLHQWIYPNSEYVLRGWKKGWLGFEITAPDPPALLAKLEPPMPDLEEFHCEMCDCTFEVGDITNNGEMVVAYCPLCGEPLDADEL